MLSNARGLSGSGRKGKGRCLVFDCPDGIMENPFNDESCGEKANQAYCGSHPYFGGYDFDPDDPEMAGRCCKPGGWPLFQEAVM